MTLKRFTIYLINVKKKCLYKLEKHFVEKLLYSFYTLQYKYHFIETLALKGVFAKNERENFIILSSMLQFSEFVWPRSYSV